MTAVGVDVERELRRGLAQVLATEKPLVFKWRPDGSAYPAGDMGIYEGVEPGAAEQSVTLTTYPVQMWPDTIVGVQVAVRAKSQARMDAAAQAVSDVLEGRWGGTLGPVTLVVAQWQSGTPLIQDGTGRRGRTDNYYLTIHRPVANR